MDVIAMNIRPMVASDIGEVVQLENKIYPQPWSERAFEDELSHTDGNYMVVESDAGIVGYAGMFVTDEEAHITTVAVVDELRGQGLGTRLILQLVDLARRSGVGSLTLEVRLSNYAARDIYRRFGFVPARVRKDYYRDDDALIMWANDIGDDAYTARIEEIRRSLR
ncbi:MAG: ribosomal protein S18-alanine N-acetyltransferase [Acidimicrobiia bacterium]|nr:ribosomal protein S18-alanine N-acetyltransferase [Acidimicrobiia bacterium]MDH3470216.1 ribosomal protein S18-alanine N-acetyltransferase [Acidimicrobiia bacterium]